jgi:hypothetical protein
MVDEKNIIWDLLAIDYRNKVAILKEEVASLNRKICFFAPEICPELRRDPVAERELPAGKEIFDSIHDVLMDLEARLERHPVGRLETPWGENRNTAIALACYRMAMEDLAEALTELAVVESRFIQQMEARPLYFPAPRIFRRRNEEFQMYLNDQLINKQQKLVREALSILFPDAGSLKDIKYRVLSSSDFIQDSQTVHNFIFQKPGRGADQNPVFTAKHPYWFQSLPIMLPEMAHEHVHICLFQLKKIGDKKERHLLEEYFNDLIGDISILFNFLPQEIRVWQQPEKFEHVIVEETIADIAATMMFGEAYLLPLFLQLVCVRESSDLVQGEMTYPLPQLPWWGRVQVLLEIFYKPGRTKTETGTKCLAGQIEAVIQDYLTDRKAVYPPDQAIDAHHAAIFEQYLVDLMVSWMRPMVQKACRKKNIRLPFAGLCWKLNEKEKENSPIHLILSENPGNHKFTGICPTEKRLLAETSRASYTLWRRAYPPGDTLPEFGSTLETFINEALLPGDTPGHGKAFQVKVPTRNRTPWRMSLDQAVPLEYFIWAGYMATVAGMEKKDKTMMGSYYQLLARGFLSGLPAVLDGTSQESRKQVAVPGGRFDVISYREGAHNARQLSFVKWRMEAFCKDDATRENYIEKLSQTTPWCWNQEEGYRFWTLAPFSALLSSSPGFSRRSSYAQFPDEKICEDSATELIDKLSCDLGIFSEEMVICPWMEFKQNQDREAETDHSLKGHETDEIWHLTVQIRIKTGQIFYCQEGLPDNTRESKEVYDPVISLLNAMAEDGLWRDGDTVFSALSWSQIVLILAPRSLDDAFKFKNALQGRKEVDRTQTTFARLISPPEDQAADKNASEKQSENGIRFQSTLRLGDIQNSAYTDLQKKLSESGRFSRVEEVPGIFDIQVTWNFQPDFSDILEIYEIGKQVDPSSNLSLISDIQTLVSRAHP